MAQLAGNGHQQHLSDLRNRHRQFWALQLQLSPARTCTMPTCLIAFLFGVLIGALICGVVAVLWAATTLSGWLAEKEEPNGNNEEKYG